MIPHLGSWAFFAATEAEAAAGIVPSWVKLLITMGVFLIPYGLGVLIARQLKLKEYAFKITVVLFAATLGVMPFVYNEILGWLEQERYQAELTKYENKPANTALFEKLQDIDESDDKLTIKYPPLKTEGPAEKKTPAE